LKITTRTLRRWSQAFAASLSETARRQGRKRHYTGDDIAMLERACQYIADGQSLADTAEQLPVITPDEKPTALVLAPEMQQVMARVAGTISEHENKIEQLEAATSYQTEVDARRTPKPLPRMGKHVQIFSPDGLVGNHIASCGYSVCNCRLLWFIRCHGCTHLAWPISDATGSP